MAKKNNPVVTNVNYPTSTQVKAAYKNVLFNKHEWVSNEDSRKMLNIQTKPCVIFPKCKNLEYTTSIIHLHHTGT